MPTLPATTTPVAASSTRDAERWALVQARDRSADGHFYYAVTSTGVFCRPSCPSRRPHRDHVRFFETTALAREAGFRPCRRCRPTETAAGPLDAAIRRVATYLEGHADQPIQLRDLAALAQVSPSHLHRQFKRALGVSPREYQAACRAKRFRQELRAGRDIAGAIYEAGYGSPSRVYESVPTGRGLSPRVYRRGGEGQRIGYAIVSCPLGRLLVAGTDKGICAVKLGDRDVDLERDLGREFPSATLDRDAVVQREWVEGVVHRLNGASAPHLPLDVRGTAFQWRVWRALERIPRGETQSYSDIARAIGRPASVRAVARACASNPVAIVVPCHRVVAKDGGLAGYRWGTERKKRLLEGERKSGGE
jgi:AraC family transcriptional regulator, regulatory protein of adaptative response / methylated-DNA-[protein]-cysteine methyltransferase